MRLNSCRLWFITLLIPLFWSSNSYAHGGHQHENPYAEFGVEIEVKQAHTFSRSVVDQLIQQGKLNKSWSQATVVNAVKKQFKEMEWVVEYSNPKELDPKQKTLYIFLSTKGELRGANFSGI